jgi:hypothetical protein
MIRRKFLFSLYLDTLIGSGEGGASSGGRFIDANARGLARSGEA